MGERVVRKFTEAEDEMMTDMRVDQMSLGQIAKLVGRAKSSVQMRLVALARRDEEAMQ